MDFRTNSKPRESPPGALPLTPHDWRVAAKVKQDQPVTPEDRDGLSMAGRELLYGSPNGYTEAQKLAAFEEKVLLKTEDRAWWVRGLLAADPDQPAPAPPPPRFRFLSASEVKDRPAPEFLVDDLLERNTVAVWAGLPESMKSLAVLDVLLSVAAGRDWHGRATEQGTVIYIGAEGASGTGMRIKAWEAINGPVPDGAALFLLDDMPQLMQTGDVTELLAAIALLPAPPAMVAIDTVARSMVGGDENSNKDMGLLIEGAEQIRRATGAVVLLVHHYGKNGTLRGASSLLGGVHTAIESTREAGSRTVTLSCFKQKNADHFRSFDLVARPVDLGVDAKGRPLSSLVFEPSAQPTPPPKPPRLTDNEQKVLDAVTELQPDRSTYAGVRMRSGVVGSSLDRALANLKSAGRISQPVDKGPYLLTPTTPGEPPENPHGGCPGAAPQPPEPPHSFRSGGPGVAPGGGPLGAGGDQGIRGLPRAGGDLPW